MSGELSLSWSPVHRTHDPTWSQCRHDERCNSDECALLPREAYLPCPLHISPFSWLIHMAFPHSSDQLESEGCGLRGAVGAEGVRSPTGLGRP